MLNVKQGRCCEHQVVKLFGLDEGIKHSSTDYKANALVTRLRVVNEIKLLNRKRLDVQYRLKMGI